MGEKRGKEKNDNTKNKKKKQTKLKMYLVARRTNRHFISARGKVGQYNLISFVKSTQS